MKPWISIALIACFLAGCESTEGLYAEGPVSNQVQLTGSPFTPEQVDRAPVPTKQVRPDFPSRMEKAGMDGTAFVVLVVDVAGNPEQVQVSQATHPLFAEAAIQAVRKWKFQPGMKDGQPVPVSVTYPIEFRRESLQQF